MLQVAVPIVGKVAEKLMDPIWRLICYPFKYKTNMEELKNQLEKLMNQREMVQHSIDAAKRQGEVIEKLVENWMRSVDKFAEEVVKPITDAEEKAAGRFCFTMEMSYSLSRKAIKATEEISRLGDGTFQKVSYRPDIQRTKSLLTRGFEDYDSRISIFEEIMKALAREDVNSIGVWGMGGVGKTTLVKRVAAQVIEDGLFGRIVFVEVSQSVDVEKLQEDIANELGMKLHKGSVSRKATQLHKRLNDETSILLILDNIWEKLDLNAVGIPFWNDVETNAREEIQRVGKSESNQKRSLILTSRDLDVLRNDMNIQKNFFVNILSYQEASNLFWKTVNPANDEMVSFEPFAIEIIRKCAGLPIAITTIASALKNKDIKFWKDALRWLKNSDPKPIKGMEKCVYSTIELSYSVLGSEEQSVFLLCALEELAYSLSINGLIKYSLGLNLFKNIDTMEDARICMDTLTNTLKTSCLLLDSPEKGRIKIHDIIRAVAISIASSNDKLMYIISSGANIKKKMIEEELPKDSTLVSYHCGNVVELPKVLEFPNLKFLHLQPKGLVSMRFSDTLFYNARKLRVLDLAEFDLPELPSSLGRLTNLRTLCLHYCQVGNVAIIGELKKLEILSLLGSEIERLPKEIGELTCLKVLDLSHCSKLKMIAPNVLSKFTCLEELYMGDSFVNWDVDGRQNASLAELKMLSNLTILELQVLEAEIIPSDLFFWKLKNYKVFIGDVWK